MTAKDETALVKKMREAANAKYGDDIVIVKYHGSPYSEAGVSDLLICLYGMFGACEVKAPESYPVKGQPSVEKAEQAETAHQRLFLDKVYEAGGFQTVCASVEHFMEFLETVAEYYVERR
jgi:hypothetical protein